MKREERPKNESRDLKKKETKERRHASREKIHVYEEQPKLENRACAPRRREARESHLGVSLVFG